MTPLLGLLPFALPLLIRAAPADPCAKIGGKLFAPPADVLACYKSFPFNETIRTNIIENAARVLDFFTFEEYYLPSPPPFQDSTTNIRAGIARLKTQKFKTDYEFHKALADFSTKFNDGHTRYLPSCYRAYQNVLPAPFIGLLENGKHDVYIAPDTVEFIELFGTEYTSYYDTIGFNWRRLAGAKVLQIEGRNPYDYVDHIADTVSGNFLDHGIRVNSAFTNYRIQTSGTLSIFSQRLGDVAGPVNVEQTSLKVRLIPANSTRAETVDIPFYASYSGTEFTDKDTYWAKNCALRPTTNGEDIRGQGLTGRKVKPQPKADIIDSAPSTGIALPDQYLPTLPPAAGSRSVIKSFILPGGKTGVLYVGSFGPPDFSGFQEDVAAAITDFKSKGVTQLLLDLHGNGGGYVCLGQYLHQYLAGSKIGYPGFVSTQRGNTLAQKIVAKHVEMAQNNETVDLFYTPWNWAFLNGTVMPNTNNYQKPVLPFWVNGRFDPTSQRFHDTCEYSFSTPVPEEPPFDLSKVAIVSNGFCASTCAMFSSLMYEHYGTKIGVFGGRPGRRIEFSGMSGNQVLDWPALDTEIKSVGLDTDPLAPPSLLIHANFRVNWRTAWSFPDPKKPIAYLAQPPQYRWYYTKETYNNPQNVWLYAEKRLF